MIRTIVVDHVCGWPNLTRLPDGRLLSAVFNHPSHGLAEAEIDCYVSKDDGQTWMYQGTPAIHEPTRNLMNVACGITGSGEYIMMVGGWDRRPAPGEEAPPYSECNRIPALVCRSADGGRTFTSAPLNYEVPGDNHVLVPYGDIHILEGGKLVCACYTCTKDMKYTRAYILFSDDDGYTWNDHSLISGDNHHETALWFHDNVNGIALCRENSCDRIDQFATSDGGRTWRFEQQVTCAGIHPAHVTKLADGQLLMTCGIRIKNLWGIAVSRSDNSGKSWSRLHAICNFGQMKDGGYPSSVQLADGQIVTHYYASGVQFHDNYFVGQVKWRYDQLFG